MLAAPGAIRVFLAFASGYFMSFGLRSVNAVIAPELVAEFGLTNAQLGSLSATYFLAFASVQIPLGVLLDRFGSLATTVPVQVALPLIGWRGVFAIAALLLVATSAAIFFALPADEPVPQGRHGESPWSVYRQVFRDRYFWRFGVVSFTVQASFVAFQSLWIGPWLRRVLAMNAGDAAQAMFLFNFVLTLGYLGLGLAVPHFARRGWTTLHVVATGTFLMPAIELAMVFASGAHTWLLWIGLAIAATCHSLSRRRT